jgi:hypothetical protein
LQGVFFVYLVFYLRLQNPALFNSPGAKSLRGTLPFLPTVKGGR